MQYCLNWDSEEFEELSAERRQALSGRISRRGSGGGRFGAEFVMALEFWCPLETSLTKLLCRAERSERQLSAGGSGSKFSVVSGGRFGLRKSVWGRSDIKT